MAEEKIPEELEEIAEGKTPDEIRDLARKLKNMANHKERQFEEEKARKIAETITLYTPVYFYVGKGKEQQLIKGIVSQVTRNGVSAETDDGKKYSRRFKKVYTESQAKKAGIL